MNNIYLLSICFTPLKMARFFIMELLSKMFPYRDGDLAKMGYSQTKSRVFKEIDDHADERYFNIVEFKNRIRKKAQAGFDLIEMLVVIAVISILAAIAIPNITDISSVGNKTITLYDSKGEVIRQYNNVKRYSASSSRIKFKDKNDKWIEFQGVYIVESGGNEKD